MRATERLHGEGQSLWLDNITRKMLDSGQLARYVEQYSVTGLTSNPSIFDKAIASGDYDDEIREKAARGITGETLFFDLAIEDLRRAADLFLPIHERTDGVDGWVSLEVSPLLAHDAKSTVDAARKLWERAGRPNLFIKIPGTAEGRVAIEECIFAGVPINVTLLFSADQYRAAADAHLRGIERRLIAGLSPKVGSVASVFMSRWDQAVNPRVPKALRDRLALAVGRDIYRAYRQLMDSVHGLAAPFTVDTMPDKTLLAFADHGELGEKMPADGGDCDAVLARFAAAGVDVGALAAQLQDEGAESFDASWKDLMDHIDQQVKS